MRMRGFLEKAVHWIGVLWAQVGVLILCLLILNAIAGVVVRNVKRFRKRSQPAREEAYGRAPWTAAYYKALNGVSARWYPYVYWKGSPLSSTYLNIDREGDRATWNSRSHHNGRPTLRVFTFGGSTMWGFGVRDDYTPASLLAKRLAAQTDYNAEVSNYGQIGYVSTQEVLALYELLSQGIRPDVVVFYDGINDCFAAYQAGIAGLTHNEFLRVREFNLLGNRSRAKNLYLAALRTLVFNTNAARLGRLLGGKDSDSGAGDDVEAREILSYLAPRPHPEAEDALERDVVSRYLFNKQIVEMLGKQFGFRCLFFWQPVIFFKNSLTPYERKFIGDPGQEKFFLATYRRMAAAAPGGGVRDFSGIFKDKNETYFTDAWHPTESGDAMIADRMAGDVAPVLAEIARNRTAPGRIETAPAPGR
ncbi:MAG TPA: SGNH/GDSL hydrolase family protein [Candidatus Binataceae bacterium]|jgi:lysophospholipase L1-like esterase|nr:SGNH/GDSL hydrolase family protein [Candidatus Binataceae bacterium]